MMDLDEVYNSTIKKTQSLLESKGIALSLREIKKLVEILYIIFDYSHKHYTFKQFEV